MKRNIIPSDTDLLELYRIHDKLIKRGEPAAYEVSNELNKLKSRFPRWIDLLEVEARFNFEIGDYEFVIPICTKMINIKPCHLTYYHRAEYYKYFNDYWLAIKDYQKGINCEKRTVEYKNCPGCSDIDVYLEEIGECYRELKKYKESIKYYTQALKIGGQGIPHYGRGLSYFLLGEYKKAIKDFDLAIKELTGIEDVDCYISRGDAYKMIKKYDKAVQDYTKAIKNSRKYPAPLFKRGLLFLEMGRKAVAYKDLKKAVKYGSIEARVLLRKIKWPGKG